MGVVVGLIFAAGVLMIWLSFFPAPPRRPRHPSKIRDLLVQAGWADSHPSAFVVLSVVIALLVAMSGFLITSSMAVSAAFGIIDGFAPYALVRARASARRTAYRELWPETLDGIINAVRAGMGLPEALSSLAERGPEAMQEHFHAFAADYAASARFSESLDRLKERFADPVADRVIEAIRLTRDVGGTDLTTTLHTLSAMLRADVRTRGELEARQSWTVNAAKLAVAAPWIVLAVLGFRADAMGAFDSPSGVLVLLGRGAASAVAYWLMLRLGALPEERRVFR